MIPKIPPKKSSLPASFYSRPTETVAEDLIGKTFLHRVEGEWIGGVIVETEAYLSENDASSHSARGMTKSNSAMFGAPGLLYVYPIHARYCLNFVTDKKGLGTAVLIRAIEPVWGIEEMQTARGQADLRRLTRGPAMLCEALGVDRSHDGINLLRDPDFRVAEGLGKDPEVVASKRIGISKAKDLLLRFTAKGNQFLSRKS